MVTWFPTVEIDEPAQKRTNVPSRRTDGGRSLTGVLRVAAPDNKRHVVTDSDHLPPSDVVIRETLEWLDRYLGPVQQAGP